MRYINEIPEFEELKEYLQAEKGGKIKSGGNQALIRCPWCGDSRDHTDAHLYIGPNKKRGLALSYYCFLCGRGSVIDNEFFRQIQCYDVNLISRVLNYNARVSDRRQADVYVPKYEYMMNPTIRNEYTENVMGAYEKLNYINNRLGVNLSFDDLTRLKIILNLERYLRDNHIRGITRRKEVLNELSNKHIGFISVDNSYVVMRAIVDPSTLIPTIQMRYVNYQIILNKFHTYTYYAIPGRVDITKEVHIHMAEGCFDILGIYFHCDKSNRTGNEIFAACSGRTFYLDLLKYFIVVANIPGCMCTVDMYLDKEKDGSVKFDDKMNYIINTVRSFTRRVVIHINDYPGEKDFGVPADRIIDKVIYTLD